MLTKDAQDIVNVLEELKAHPSTVKYLDTPEEGSKYLPIDNILNGHVECKEEDYRTLLNKVHELIHGNLISSQGGHSKTYYELKKAGYVLIVTEKDSFGPLGCGMKVPDTDWWVYYG